MEIFFLYSSVVMSVITLLLFPLEHRVVAYGMSWRSYFFYGITKYPEFTIQTIKKMSIRVILYVVISLATTSIINKERIEEIQKK